MAFAVRAAVAPWRATGFEGHLVLVTEGQLTVGERVCGPGMLLVLEKGAVFGPLIAGSEAVLCGRVGGAEPGSRRPITLPL